ncbi:MAG TPA: hypothetical protein VME66_11845 [Candidatus Acidoferrales bacterium]|nr:hypothetical protein [Candidatus Acidoferrales bacterium]
MVRLIWYAIIVGLASAVAQREWTDHGLDGALQFDQVRAQAPYYIGAITLGLAIFSRIWLAAATLLFGALVGALVTAPLAIAQALGQ